LKDKIWSLASYQTTIEIFKFLHFLGIEQISKLFEKIKGSCPFIDETFFFEEEIKTLNHQITKFNKKLKEKKKTQKELKEKKNTSKKKDLKPEIQKQDPIKLNSETFLNNILKHKNYFLRSVFRKNEEIKIMQTHLLNYKHYKNKAVSSFESIFSQTIPPNQINANEQAIDRIYQEMEIFDKLEECNTKFNFDSVTFAEVSHFKEQIRNVINMNSPNFKWEDFEEEKLEIRNDSMEEIHNVTDSMAKDSEYLKQKHQIENIKVLEELKQINSINISKEKQEKSQKEIKLNSQEQGTKNEDIIQQTSLYNSIEIKSNQNKSMEQENEKNEDLKRPKTKDSKLLELEIESAIQDKMKNSQVFKKSEEMDKKRSELGSEKSHLQKTINDLKEELKEQQNKNISFLRTSINKKRNSVSKSISKKLENSRILIKEIEK
jgi:hypothetical protein